MSLEQTIEPARAEAAQRVDHGLLSDVSHEIRTPLSGILGMNALLLRTNLDVEQRQYATALRDSAEALLSLVDSMLDLSRLEAGQVEPEAIEFDLGTLVDGVFDLLTPQAAGKGIALGAAFRAGCPRNLRGDPTRLRQVLVNLVGNAVKFTERGSVEVGVGLLDADAGRVRLRFEVKDTGIGMNLPATQRLFRRFSQADASIARRYGGTGLGLALSRRLVEWMGGRIGVESAPGCGSTFWFTVVLAPARIGGSEQTLRDLARRGALQPLPVDGTPGGSGPQAARSRDAAPVRPAARRVLVVEDNPIGQTIAASLLRRAALDIDLAEDGAQAIDAVRRRDYGLVLMDLRMPVLDGIEATRRIRAMQGPASRVPVIAMTAHAMRGDRERCLAAGMNDCLSKPIDAAALLRAVGRWLPGIEKTERTTSNPNTPTRHAPLFDETALAGLRAVMTTTQLDALIEDWLQSCRESIGRMPALVDRADLTRLTHEAHDLCGTAATFGAVRLAQHASALEQACARADLAEARHVTTALARDVQPTCDALRERADAPRSS